MNFYRETLGELLLSDPAGVPEGIVFTTDSRKVKPGMGFAAVAGSKVDGHSFIPQVLSAGAKVILHDHPAELPPGTPHLLVSDSGRAYALLVRAALGNPDEALTLVGVTGTNGKTTTAFLLANLLNASGIPCGLISTIEYRDGAKNVPGDRTTPDSDTLFALFDAMKKNRLKAAAMELSSHALDQGRAKGCLFQEAIFTNLTGDHLDYHGDMEHYFEAKKLFFTELLAENGSAVINVDDPWGRRLAAELKDKKVITFGTAEDACCRIEKIRLTGSGVEFRLAGKENLEIRSALVGLHNIHNLAGVIIAALDLGIPAETVSSVLRNPGRIPGRLESFTAPSGAQIYIDFAHTDDALANVLRAVRPAVAGKLTVLFGAGGDRDRTKRPRMGQAAARFADALIVTSDNPRSEEPEAIIGEIVKGIPAGKDYTVIPDRRKAIRSALAGAKVGDAVLIAGKGHENYQEIRGVRHPFSDREEVLREFAFARLENYLASRLSMDSFPELGAQIALWREEQPLRNVKIFEALPLYPVSAVKYLALLASGAKLTLYPGSFRNREAAEAMKECGLRLAGEPELNELYDAVCQYGEELKKVSSRTAKMNFLLPAVPGKTWEEKSFFALLDRFFAESNEAILKTVKGK